MTEVAYKKILLVDDDDEILEILVEYFSSIFPDAQVLSVNRPDAALKMIEAGDIDIIVSDLHMPHMTGLQLREKVSHMQQAKGLNLFAIITGLPTQEALLAKSQGKIQALMTKPFSESSLREGVNILLKNGLTDRATSAAEPTPKAVPVNAEPEAPKQVSIDEKHLERLESLALIGEMTATIVHEINNPLSYIMGATAIIKRALVKTPIDVQKLDKTADGLARMALRLEKIIDGTKTLARAAALESELQLVSVQQLLGELEDLATYIAKGIVLNIVQPPSPIYFYGNDVQILQVMTNLLSNARDALEHLSSQEQWIKINAFAEGEYFVCDIANGGPKIDQEVAKRIFEKFFTTKVAGKGTGLGLNLCTKIVEKHKGKIELLMDQVHTTFRFSIPKVEDFAYEIL